MARIHRRNTQKHTRAIKPLTMCEMGCFVMSRLRNEFFWQKSAENIWSIEKKVVPLQSGSMG